MYTVGTVSTKMKQQYSSEKTSVNIKKFPRVYTSKIFLETLKDGVIITDIGAGKYSAVDKMFGENIFVNDRYREAYKDIDLSKIKYYPFDKYNRSEKVNVHTLKQIVKTDVVIISNVLNVIKEHQIRIDILDLAKSFLNNGKIFISVYVGNKSGIGKVTKSGWQENRVLKSYIKEVSEVFDNYFIKDGLIVIG